MANLLAVMIPTAAAWGTGALVVLLILLSTLSRVRKEGWNSFLNTSVKPAHPVIPMPAVGGRPSARETPLIQQCRNRMGRRPRSFDPSLKKYLGIYPPVYLKSSDDLSDIYQNQDRIRREGKVVWASTVQSNSNLFRPGPNDHPASVIWSEDPSFDIQPDDLTAIAGQLFKLKGTRPGDAGAAKIADLLTNEMKRGARIPIPEKMAGGRAVYHSSLMVVRKHLPAGYLTGNLMPVWTDPQPTGMVLLVPAAYWPAELLAHWSK